MMSKISFAEKQTTFQELMDRINEPYINPEDIKTPQEIDASIMEALETLDRFEKLLLLQNLEVFYNACAKNYVQLTKAILSAGADPDHASIKGNTPLIIACDEGNQDIVELLLKAGANPNQANTENYNGFTPLTMVCANNHVDIVIALLEKGANPNQEDMAGCTPLAMAGMNGHADIIKVLISHNQGAALLHQAHVNHDSFISILSRTEIDFEPIIDLVQDAFKAKSKLAINKKGENSNIKKFAQSFFKAFSDQDIQKIMPSNAFGILKALDKFDDAIHQALKTSSSLEKLINAALNDSGLHLELLDYTLKHSQEFGYKYATQVATKIIEAAVTEIDDTNNSGIIRDANLIIAIHNYEKKSGKLYKKPLEVFKHEIESIDPTDEIYFVSDKTPLIIEILDGFSFSASDANIVEYIAKYNRAKTLQDKLKDTQTKFFPIFDDLNKASHISQAKSAKSKHKPMDSKLREDIDEIEERCLEVASAKEAGIFVDSKDFLKQLRMLNQKLVLLGKALNHHELLLSQVRSDIETFASTEFDPTLSLDNLIKYSKSKDDSFKTTIKAMFTTPEKRLDSKTQEKFIDKFEIAILQAEATGEISPNNAKYLYRVKHKVSASFLKAYLQNTTDGVLRIIDDKFSGIDDRTTILTTKTYVSSVAAAGIGAAWSHISEEDDRGLEDFEEDEFEEADSENETDASVTGHKEAFSQMLTNRISMIFQKIHSKENISVKELKALAENFDDMLEFISTKSGWVLKYLPTGNTVGSHIDHASKAKFLPKNGDGGKTADLYDFFDQIECFKTYLEIDKETEADRMSGSSSPDHISATLDYSDMPPLIGDSE